MKKRGILVAALSLALAAGLALVGCGGPKMRETGLSGVPDGNGEQPPAGNWHALDYDEDMDLNGVLNEPGWSAEAYSYVSGNVSVSVRARFTSLGVYAGVSARDRGVYADAGKAVSENTNVTLYLAPAGVKSMASAVRVSADALGRMETYVGGETGWTKRYAASTSGVLAENGVGADGTGMTAEFFVPWRTFGLNKAPECVLALPEYCKADASFRQTKIRPEGTDGDLVATYLTVSANGSLQGAASGLTLGDSVFGHAMSAHWERDEAGGRIATTSGSTEERAFFEGFKSKQYFLTATVQGFGTDTDPFPKMGLIAGQNADGTLIYMVDAETAASKTVYAVFSAGNNTVNWDWPGANSKGVSAYQAGIDWSKGVEISVLRSGEVFYFYVNGAYLFKRIMAGYDKDAAVGFITFGERCEFRSYSLTTAAAVVAAKKAALTVETADWSGTANYTVSGADGFTIAEEQKNIAAEIAGERSYLNSKNLSVSGAESTLSMKLSDVKYAAGAPDSPQLSVHLTGTGEAHSVKVLPALNRITLHFGMGASIADLSATDWNAEHEILLTRTVRDGMASVRLFFDGKLAAETQSAYTGSYSLGFSAHYFAGAVSGLSSAASVQKFHVTLPENVAHGVVTASALQAELGARVVLTVTPDSGYRVVSLNVNGIERKHDIANGKLALEGLSEDVIVTAAFEQIPAEMHTVSGTLTLTGNLAGSVDTAAMRVIAQGSGMTISGTIRGDGTYEIAGVPRGEYRLVFFFGGEIVTMLENVTVAESDLTGKNATWNVPDNPALTGKLSGKELYYSNARKLAFDVGGESTEVYAYLGTDGVYLLWNVADASFEHTSTEVWNYDNVELVFTLPRYLLGGRTKDQVFRILMNVNGADLLQSYNGTDWSGSTALKADSRKILEPGKGYVVEMRVPYTSLGTDAAPDFLALGLGRLNVKNGVRYYATAGDADLKQPLTYSRLYADRLLNARDIVITDASVDGDLSDWENFETDSWKVKETNGDRGVSFLMKKEEAGLRIAGRAVFKNLNTAGAEWWHNTNIELWLDTLQIGFYMTAKNQFACTVTRLPYLLRSVLTESGEGEARRYTLTFELLIPDVAYGEDGMLVGFAFKSGSTSSATAGDFIEIEGRGYADDWWYVNGHNPGKASEQIEVTAAGMRCRNTAHAPHFE